MEEMLAGVIIFFLHIFQRQYEDTVRAQQQQQARQLQQQMANQAGWGKR